MYERIEAIAASVPVCRTAADIGCDHGLISEYILRKGRAGVVIAVDISDRSLSKARRLAEAKGLSIITRLGNGLVPINAGEAQAVVIAGMGGMEICNIIGASLSIAHDAYLVLSPHKNAYELRKFLCIANFNIARDFIVYESGKYYDIICAERGEDSLDETQLQLGKFYVDAALIPEFLRHEYRRLRPHCRSERNMLRLQAIQIAAKRLEVTL